MKHIVIAGATSAISQAVSKQLISDDVCFHLVGRDMDKLEIVSNDLISRGCGKALCYSLDFNDFTEHQSLIEKIKIEADKIDILFVCYGIMHSQDECEENVNKALEQVTSNYTSAVSLLVLFTQVMYSQGEGTIAVVSSVAGDRGRKSNFIYGSAKGGLSTFLEGLRYKLYDAGINVLTVKPGFVDSPMTTDMKKGLLWASPELVAKYIVKAIKLRKSVIYTPHFWFFIMTIIKIIPVFIFRKLNI